MEYITLREHMIHDMPNDFNDFLQENIKITKYLPIGRKYAIIDIFSTSFSYTISDMLQDKFSTFSDILMKYEMDKMFDILFRYIDIDFDVRYKNSEEYDLIMQSGLYDYILQYCGKDYNRICSELDVAVGIKDMSIIQLFNEKLSMVNIADTERMIEAIEGIDKNKIDKLLKIAEMNDPLTKDVVDAIRTESYKVAIKKAIDESKYKKPTKKNKKVVDINGVQNTKTKPNK